MPLKQFSSEKELVSFVTSGKLPEWQRKLFKQYAEAVQVHSQGQVFYKIDRLFPNEHPESKHNRLLSFESITEASFGRAANNVNRIFKNSSYSVEASEKVIALTSEHTFEGLNFYSWFLDQWVKYALKQDPNSRIVVYPPEYSEDKKSKVVFVASEYIRHLDEDNFVFISEEESEIEYEVKTMSMCSERFYDQSINMMNVKESAKNTYTPKLEGTIKRYVYHAFFKGVGMYRLSQVSNGSKEFEFEFFPFEQDFLPVIDAGGEKGPNEVNKSFLHPFVSFGNLALVQHSQHTAVNFIYSFPRMSEIQTPCDGDCQEGKIRCESADDIAKYGSDKPCLKCGGTGYTRSQTPNKVYIKKFDPSGMEGDQKHLEVDDVKYYTPPTGILEYSKKEWKDYLEMAETAVYISQRVQTGNVESAESKEVSQEDMYAFLVRVGQCFYNRLRFVLQCFENYLVKSPMEVAVQVPYSYAILSEGEAFLALKDILSSSVPIMLKASQVEGFINKFVSQSSPVRKFIEVLNMVDPLLYYSINEITSFKLSGVVTPEQYSVHVFAYPTLQNMYATDKNLFVNDNSIVAEKLKKELVQFKPVPQPTLKEKIIAQQ